MLGVVFCGRTASPGEGSFLSLLFKLPHFFWLSVFSPKETAAKSDVEDERCSLGSYKLIPLRTVLGVPSGRPAEDENLGAYGGRVPEPALLLITPGGCKAAVLDLAKCRALFDVCDSLVTT